MKNKNIKAVVFDVDGVIFKTHDDNGRYLWSQNIKEDIGITSNHLSFIFSEKWDKIILGKIDLRDHLNILFKQKSFSEIKTKPQQYIDYWLSHDHHVNQDILNLVASLNTPCYLGTNQEHLRTTHILNTVGSYFKECFASYKIGFIKPEQGFFQHIQKALSLLPHELLLIDDTKSNIDGAQNCGWHVYHYQNDIKCLSAFLKSHKIMNG